MKGFFPYGLSVFAYCLSFWTPENILRENRFDSLITKKGKVFFSELWCYEKLEITLNEYFHGVD
jgi:hypothetical protein